MAHLNLTLWLILQAVKTQTVLPDIYQDNNEVFREGPS